MKYSVFDLFLSAKMQNIVKLFFRTVAKFFDLFADYTEVSEVEVLEFYLNFQSSSGFSDYCHLHLPLTLSLAVFLMFYLCICINIFCKFFVIEVNHFINKINTV